MDGDDKQTKRQSFIEGLTVAASALTSPLSYESDESTASAVEDIPKPSQQAPDSVETPNTTGTTPYSHAAPSDTNEATREMTRLQKIRRINKPRLKVKKTIKPKSASHPYFVALLWGILLTRVWMNIWILQLIPIPFAIYLIKLAVVWSGAWAYCQEFIQHWYVKSRQWYNERQDALVPAPIRAMTSLVIRGDQKVLSLFS